MDGTPTRRERGTAGTDAERRAALELAGELRAMGREARIVTLWVRPAWWAPQVLAAALGVLASVLAVDHPVIGVVVAACGLAIALADLAPVALPRRLTPARATQNVVSAPPTVPDGAVTLIITAAVDRPRSGLLRRVPGGGLRWQLAALAAVAACSALRVADIGGGWIGPLQLLPTIVLFACLAALLDQAVARPGDDGDVALDTALALAASLDADPPSRVAVAVVLAGAGDVGAAGLRAWLRDRRRRGLRPSDVAILHLEPRPGEPPGWWARDGLVVASALHPQLVDAARRAAAAPGLGARELKGAAGTAAAPVRGDGWPVIAIAVGDAISGQRFASALVGELDAGLS